jgi:DNA-binding IscR family transcriptional regulator
MSFNDLAAIYAYFEQLPVGYINPTEASVIIAIARQPNGCFIGEVKLAAQARTSVGNLNKVLVKLRRLGIVTGDQRYARKGLRQCYRVSVSGLGAYVERVSVKTPFESMDSTEAEMGISKTVKGIFESATAYPVGHPYKEYKQYKNDKDERFSFITKDLPESVKALIEYAPNVSDELNELERQGISLERIKGALEDTDFTNAYKVGGLFMSVLRGLRVSVAPIVEKPIEVFEPRKCDVCKSGCVFGNSLAEFEQGARCELATATEYRITKQRNGLEP